MKVNKSFYVILNEENKYYNETYEYWFEDIIEATRYDYAEEAMEIAEDLNRFTKQTRIASVSALIEIIVAE